jgi:hypothetical protein
MDNILIAEESLKIGKDFCKEYPKTEHRGRSSNIE